MTDILTLKRGDVVVAIKHMDPSGANVRPGTQGVVFQPAGYHEADTGPMVRWANMGACNVYDGYVDLVK